MALIRYFKSFKDFVPTWVICLFFCFWVFIWPLAIGIILCIIQFLQRRKSEEKKRDAEHSKTIINDAAISSGQDIENEKKLYELKALLELEEDKRHSLEHEVIAKNELIQHCQSENAENKKNLYAAHSKMEEMTAEKEAEAERLYGEIRKKQHEIEKLRKYLEEKNDDIALRNSGSFVLCAGKYKGGIDVPIGIYNIKIVEGECLFEVNKPDDVSIWMSFNEKTRKEYNYAEKYNNLEVSDKTTIKINKNANIEFSISRAYDFSEETKLELEEVRKEIEKERGRLEKELLSIKTELNILNNELIKQYYIFSNYDNITSEECKNKIVLLKQKEKELRQNDLDVIPFGKARADSKLRERATRQILRVFNAECDSILLGIGLKNIDSCRKKVQQSYETLNKLFAVDAIYLSKEILELKLEQATLMYTYELKYRQEKEIQKAIKEQMIEEAKAQREIEEQKKKVEKDLQQHMGEVNRLMKYLQKAQIDAEKQMYMDKIRELEEKIKSLEADKQLVLEREANATAGFVYIISNIGSFGEDIYKIGMTRRLEPMDRIHELSSASVPFEFDVHAMIFSSNAPELENNLHKHFADKQVNKVNPRKEFFNVNIDEIEKVVKKNYNDTVKFTKVPVAAEYRQSLHLAGTAS